MVNKEQNKLLEAAGKRFKSIRELNGFTQEQVGCYLSVDRTLIAKFEAGERSLGMSCIERACRLFGCETDAVLSDREYHPLAVTYRAKDLKTEDMEAIAKVRQIALNLRRIKDSLGGEQRE